MTVKEQLNGLFVEISKIKNLAVFDCFSPSMLDKYYCGMYGARTVSDLATENSLHDLAEIIIEFYGTKYSIGCGGIHTQDPPGILKSTDKYVYIHHDYTSYYPSIMISYNVAPKHLHQKTFTKMMSFLKDTRVKCKHGGDVNVIENLNKPKYLSKGYQIIQHNKIIK